MNVICALNQTSAGQYKGKSFLKIHYSLMWIHLYCCERRLCFTMVKRARRIVPETGSHFVYPAYAIEGLGLCLTVPASLQCWRIQVEYGQLKRTQLPYLYNTMFVIKYPKWSKVATSENQLREAFPYMLVPVAYF